MTTKQCEAFATLVGRFSGWLGADDDGRPNGPEGALTSDLLNLALRYGAPQSFVDEYQEWSAR